MVTRSASESDEEMHILYSGLLHNGGGEASLQCSMAPSSVTPLSFHSVLIRTKFLINSVKSRISEKHA